MQLSDEQAQLLKDWLIKKLENDSDADSDVLADYVLALVRGDGTPDTLRAICIENLRDFLQDGTEIFVDQVIAALNTGSYDPNQKPVPPSLQTTAGQLAAPTGPRKRAFDDRDDHTAPHGRFGNADRPMKQPRRGAGRGGARQGGQAMHNQPLDMASSFPAGMNMQDALGAMAAMQQAMGLPPLPGMEQFAGQGAGVGSNMQFSRSGAFDNNTRGQRGARGGRERGRGRGRGALQNGRRAEFSSAGPNSDKSITAVVIEQIPEDKFDEQSIRSFFDQFGTIQQLDLQPHKHLAVVTYTSWDEANAAYSSPKVIFDNRFVKVFWYKPDAHQHITKAVDGDVEMKSAEPEIDPEEVARRQEEAQRKHEEAKRARDEAAKQKQDIDAKLNAMEAERIKMAELLARKANKSSSTTQSSNSTEESEQTKGLKAQLAKLEAEAKSLGIDPNADDQSSSAWQSSWRGRGAFRARGNFPTRGRGAVRGAWPGASARGGAVKRLDNRPRTVAVIFPSQGMYDKYDEAMRQYLLFADYLEHATLSKHPDRQDAAMVVFEERYRAENFISAVKSSNGIPYIGAVETAWMANPAPTAISATASPAKTTDLMPVDGASQAAPITQDSKMDMTDTAAPVESGGDLDIAEDDQWD